VRALLLNQFYPPDVAPTGQALHDLARALSARGHEVDVLHSGASSARTRMVAKGLDYASYAVRLAVASRSLSRPDVIVTLTTPPYLGLLSSLVPRWRGVPRVEWSMDVYPDVLAAHGLVGRDGIVHRALSSLARRQLRNAAAVIALGPFMARVLEPRAADARRVTWVPLWGERVEGPAPPAEVAAIRRSRGWTDGDLVLLYSGNMGRAHRISEFLEAAGRLGPDGPRWAFLGGGFRRAEVLAFTRERPAARVELLPYEPRERLRASLSAADVHLASLSAGWEGRIAPSKVQAAFAVGRPILFLGPRDNEASSWVEESGGGWVVAEGDVPGLLAAVDEARDPAERSRRGQAGLAFARARFDPARNVERVARIVEDAALT
jgi:putative colanic acid biosynthesis glycosyltransferase WcaI